MYIVVYRFIESRLVFSYLFFFCVPRSIFSVVLLRIVPLNCIGLVYRFIES